MTTFTIQLDFDRTADITIGGKGKVYKITEKVLVMPYTEFDRRRAYLARGRESFSYGKAVCVLPSARFNQRSKNRIAELETYRDEED